MLAKLQDVANAYFDYVIVGGGTAGLIIAARLSEDCSKTVCVLEAGPANLDDPEILTPSLSRGHFGNKQYSWNFETAHQKACLDKAFLWSRGRGLGGSSAMNFHVWTKPPANDIDDWERLGNPGWNWKNYQKYIHKAERLAEPAAKLRGRFKLPLYEGDVGREGALAVSYPRTISEMEPFLMQAFENAGVPTAPRPYGGDPNGAFWTINSLDQETATRSYASTAYYLPNRARPNLTVLPEAHVARLASKQDAAGNLTITGVEFLYNEKPYVVYVKQEAILSAGSLKSPQILELSGIGSRAVLEKAGVEVKVDLPGVGENLQEHIWGGFAWELKPEYDFPGLHELKHQSGRERHIELYKTLTGAFTMGLVDFAFVPLERIAGATEAQAIYDRARAQVGGTTRPGLRKQYALQLARLRPGVSSTSPICEVVGVPTASTELPIEEGKAYMSWTYGLNSALSRGHVHITSSDPKVQPELDPRYFKVETDLDALLAAAKFARNMVQYPPIKDMVARELVPGPDVETDEQFAEFVKSTFSTTWHTCGTCSMLPREDGGVVDPTLCVYGTHNLRVVDLSIVPLHFSAHAQATVYAVSEQAADIIKGMFQP